MAEPAYSATVTGLSLITLLLGLFGLCKQPSFSVIMNAFILQSLIQMINVGDFHGHRLNLSDDQIAQQAFIRTAIIFLNAFIIFTAFQITKMKKIAAIVIYHGLWAGV